MQSKFVKNDSILSINIIYLKNPENIWKRHFFRSFSLNYSGIEVPFKKQLRKPKERGDFDEVEHVKSRTCKEKKRKERVFKVFLLPDSLGRHEATSSILSLRGN